MKKLLVISVSILLCFVSVFTCGAFPVDVYYPYSYNKTAKLKGNDFVYRVIDNKYIEIIKGVGFIPKEIDGLPVTKIGDYSYMMEEEDNEYTFVDEKWTIPETVTYIGSHAFEWNYLIKSISIPSSVTYIGDGAFNCCYKLKSVSIPPSVSSIPEQAFSNCGNLKTVELPYSIEIIGASAFFDCVNLSSINMPVSLRRINKGAFYNCKSLKKVDFSEATEVHWVEEKALGYYYNKSMYYYDSEYYDSKKSKDSPILKGFKIVWEPDRNVSEKSPAIYALKNNIPLTYNVDSKNERKYNNKFVGECKAGDTVKIIVDGKKLSDFKAKNSKIIKITKDGKVTGLKKGSTKVTVTLPTGKKYTGEFHVSNDPALKKKAQNGKYKTVKTVSVKQGKTASVKVFGRAPKINNKYTNTRTAKVISKKNASTLKIMGLRPGTTTLKIKVNGVKTIKLKVKVTY